MIDTRERCVECGHFICPDTDPSPPGDARPVAAPGEVEEQLLAKAQHFDGWDGDPETAALLRKAATALASAHRRAEEAEAIALANEEAGRAAVAGGIAQIERVASLTSRLEAAEKERDEARAKYQELILSENVYGPALAQQDRHIEELESKCERLISSCERTESERDEAKRALNAATAEAERLTVALEEIVNPLKFMQARAEAEGARLSGMAHTIANSVEHLKGIARAALTPAPSKEGDGE
jgi:chromosome segregation ATPase